MLDIPKTHLPADAVKGIGGTGQKNTLTFIVVVDLSHGMDCSFYPAFLTSTKLQTACCFLDVILDEG